MIKAVILDMDGTMFDTERVYIEEAFKLQREHGITPNMELQLQAIGGNAALSEKRYREAWGDEVYERYAPLSRELLHTVHIDRDPDIKTGLFELLNYLKENGYKIGVATSTPQRAAEASLIRGKADVFLDAVVYGDMLPRGRGKPNPDIFLKTCALLGVAPEEALGIEDSHNGLRALHAAGMMVVMVPDLLPCTPEIEALLHYKFDTLLEVVSLLERMKKQGKAL